MFLETCEESVCAGEGSSENEPNVLCWPMVFEAFWKAKPLYGLTSASFEILAFVAAKGGAILVSDRELCREIHITAPTLRAALRGLKAAGLLDSGREQEGRRYQIPRGAEGGPQMVPVLRKLVERPDDEPAIVEFVDAQPSETSIQPPKAVMSDSTSEVTLGRNQQCGDEGLDLFDETNAGDGATKKTLEDWALEIYRAYPRRANPEKARKVIVALLRKKFSPGYLLDRTRVFSSHVEQWPEDERCFIPHPSSFFLNKRFLQDYEKEFISFSRRSSKSERARQMQRVNHWHGESPGDELSLADLPPIFEVSPELLNGNSDANCATRR